MDNKQLTDATNDTDSRRPHWGPKVGVLVVALLLTWTLLSMIQQQRQRQMAREKYDDHLAYNMFGEIYIHLIDRNGSAPTSTSDLRKCLPTFTGI